jgi:hypothetical protein
MTHGGFLENPPVILDDETSLKNIFICSKAAFGCMAFSGTHHRFDDTTLYGKEGKMYYTLDKFKSVPFDVLTHPNFNDELLSVPICRSHRGSNALGDAMINRIVPKTHSYMDKEFSRDIRIKDKDIEGLDFRMIIDVEKLNRVRSHYNMHDILTMSYEDEISLLEPIEGTASDIQTYFKIVAQADILFDPTLHTTLETDNENGQVVVKRNVTMSAIVEYYNNRNKTNLFVYDESCGVLNPLSEILDYDTYIASFNEKYPLSHESRRHFPQYIEPLRAINESTAKIGHGTRRNKKRKTKRRNPKKKLNHRTRNKRRGGCGGGGG